MSPFRLARALAIVAGSLDVGSGLGLVAAPAFVLPTVFATPAPEAPAAGWVRLVGAFVFALGGSYWWAVLRGGEERLRCALEMTLIFRLTVGAYAAVAIIQGWLGRGWLAVPLADFALLAAQVWLLCKKPWRHE